MKKLVLFTLVCLFSLSAMATTCYVTAKNATNDDYDTLIATVDNAFENDDMSNLVVITADGDVIINFGEKDMTTTSEEEFEALKMKLTDAVAFAFSKDESGNVSILSGTLDVTAMMNEGNLFVGRSVAYGAMNPSIMLIDMGLEKAGICQ